MQLLFGFVGIGLVFFTMYDVIQTTLGLNRGGPITTTISRWMWSLSLRIHRAKTAHRLLAVNGILNILLTIVIWTTLMWFGWALIFNIGERAILQSSTMQPADFWDRFYFAGYTIITLGIGDYVPNGPVWQVLTPLSSASGFFLVTLAITYLLSIVSGAVEKRTLALSIDGLGSTPDKIVGQAWNGQDFGMLTDHLVDLGPQVITLGQQYLAYPVLHDIHSPQPDAAVSLRLVILDEALTLLEHGVAPDHRPDPVAVYPLRRAIATYLDIVHSEFIHRPTEPPPLPPLSKLQAHGVPTVSEKDFHTAVEEMAEHRAKLVGAVLDDGWSWRDIC